MVLTLTSSMVIVVAVLLAVHLSHSATTKRLVRLSKRLAVLEGASPSLTAALLRLEAPAPAVTAARIEVFRARVEAQAVLLRAVVLQAGASDRVVQMQVSDFEKWLGQQEQIMLSRGEDACDHDFVRMRRDPDFAAMLRDVHDEREMH